MASCATLQEVFQIKTTAESFIVVIELGQMPLITPVLPTDLFITQRKRHVEALVKVCFVTILLLLRIMYISYTQAMNTQIGCRHSWVPRAEHVRN